MLCHVRLPCLVRPLQATGRLSIRGSRSRLWINANSYATKPASKPVKPQLLRTNAVPHPSKVRLVNNVSIANAQALPATGTSTSAAVRESAPPLPVGTRGYPQFLLIYHAGTGRTIFISSFKLIAIFVFIWSAVLLAPGYYFSPLEPNWKAVAAVAGGAVPLVVMVLTTAPFVTYVHLALPQWARASQLRLMRYAQNLPSSAVVDITSLRWIWPRVTRLHASELYIHKGQLGAMTLRRNIPQAVSDARQWWQWRPLRQFYVAGQSHKVPEKGIWEMVIGCIARNKGPSVRNPPKPRR